MHSSQQSQASVHYSPTPKRLSLGVARPSLTALWSSEPVEDHDSPLFQEINSILAKPDVPAALDFEDRCSSAFCRVPHRASEHPLIHDEVFQHIGEAVFDTLNATKVC